MAEIRKIVRSDPLSNFQQVAPGGGITLAVLADAANSAYEHWLPAATEQMAQEGDAAGRAQARDAFGNTSIPSPAAPTAPDGGLAGYAVPPPAISEPGAGGAPLSPIVTTPLGPSVNGAALGVDFGRLEGEYGIPNGYLGRTAQIESGGNPNAQNPNSSAGGLFQFIDSTASQYGLTNRTDPVAASAAAARLAADNAAQLRSALGREPTAGELYLAHQQGSGGAVKLLSNPNARAADLVGAEAVRLNGGDPNMTAQQFANLWISKFGTAGATSPVGGPVPQQTTLTDPTLPADVRSALFPPTATVSSSGAPSAVSQVAQPQPPPPGAVLAAPPTMIRTASGRLEPRRFSPIAGPMREAYDAAAKGAFLQEAMIAGQADIMGLSEQFPMQPDAFLEQGRGYVDTVVAGVDPALQRGLREELTNEVGRRYLGMVDERNTDIRQRAENSNQALVERYSSDYAEALAAGNADDATVARANLEGALYFRESIPGVAWTRENSQNVLLDAVDQSQRISATRRDQQAAAWKDSLNTIIDARENGMVGADESILDNPEVWATNPELATEAQAWVEFRAQMPGFDALTPSQQDAVVADMRLQPVQDTYQIKMIETAQKAAAASREAWALDPVAQAAKVMPTPPPELPDSNTANPGAFISALHARRDYMLDVQRAGYTDQPTFLSETEATNLSLVMGKDMPPDVRLALAAGMVSGFGDNAVTAFDQLDIDPVLRWGGKMMALGGSQAVAATALRGQQMLDEGLVSVPPRLASINAVSTDIASALAATPVDDVKMTADVLSFSSALYAAQASGIDPDSDAAKALMEASIQQALGQDANARGRLTGGVQDVLGQPVLLPPGISGDDMNGAFSSLASTLPGGSFMLFYERMGNAITGTQTPPDQWLQVQSAELPPSLPYAGGQILDRQYLAGGHIQLIPMGGTTYRMQIVQSGETVDVATQDGNIFMIDANRLLEVVRP
jgi:hypothetical protein